MVMAGNEILVGIQLSFCSAAATYMLPGKNVDPTLVDGYPGARNFKSGIVPLRVQYDAEKAAAVDWGHSKSSNPIQDSLLHRAGWNGFHLETDGELLDIFGNGTEARRDEMAAAQIREFLSKLIAHILKRGKVAFGARQHVTYHVAISVPPWWYGKVQASVLEPPNLESGAKLKIEIIPEPVCCIAYFFSLEKKHPLSVNSGNDGESLMYHCSMDDRYTTVTRVLVQTQSSSPHTYIEKVVIHGLSTAELSNTFRELLEEKLAKEVTDINEESTATETKFQKIIEEFIKFLPRFNGMKDCKLRLPWKLPDSDALGIRSNQITFEASTLREQVFKKIIFPLATFLTNEAQNEGSKVYVLCNGALSECPYVPSCLGQLLVENGKGQEVEVLSTMNGETSAARGAAIFLDIPRQHTEISHIEPLPKETNVVLDVQSVFNGLNGRINAVLGTETKALSKKEALALERKAYFLLREHLERYAWEPLLLRLFTYIHALNITLKKKDASTDLRKQFDEVFKAKNVLEESVQNRDLAFWFYETGASPELLAFLTDTGSSVNAVTSFDGESGVHPIHVAAKHRQVAILEWLLDKGAHIDAKTNQGSTCLHWALRGPFDGHNDNTAVLETLLAIIVSQYPVNKSLLNAEDANGCTALDSALGSGLEAECLLLRNAGAEENSKVKELRHTIVSAIEQDDQKFVQDTIQKSPDLCHGIQLSGGMNILQLAVRRRSFNCAHIILQECKEPSALINAQDVGGWSALHFAVFLEDLATTALLLDYGADLEVSTGEGYGSITFQRGVNGNRAILSVDYSKPLSAKKRGRWKPLHITAMMGNEPITQLLLDSGAHLHFKDMEGYTPIRRAISKGHEQVVEIILRHYTQGRNNTDASPEITEISDAVYPPATRPVPAADCDPSRTEAIQGALGDAVKIGNEKIVVLLLNTGLDVDERSPQSGWTPLSHAIAQQDENLAAILLRNRADPRIIHSDGSTLLHLAAEGKDVQLVQMLLPYCPVKQKDNHGTTALHRAATKGYSPIAKILLNNGAEINSADHEERTALYIAVENVNLPVAQFLLDSGARVQRVGGSQKTLLHAAVDSGNSWALKFVMSQKGIQDAALEAVDDNGDTFLDTAAKGGHAKLLGELLRLYKPQNLWRPVLRTFFAMAESGNVDMLKVIIQHDKKFLSAFGAVTDTARIASVGGIGAVSKSSWTALHVASWHGQPSAVEVLLASGASLATEAAGLTPLGLVCVTPQEQFCDGHLKVCELLVSKGASLANGGLGHTTLHLAAIAGHADLLELLLSQGAAISAGNEQGYSALQCAVESGNTMAVSILVERGCQTASSSLHLAAHSGRMEIAQLLTSKGAQVNFVGKDGFTPLMVAAAIGHVAMLEHLLENGADLSFRTADKGHSPLDMAVISHQLGSVIAIFNSPSYSAKFRTDRSYAWTAAGKDSSSESKIWKHIYERTECHRDHGAAILHWAVANSNEQLLDLAMQSGIDLKVPDSDGWSAFHAAAMAGNTGMLKVILAKGIEIDYQGHSLRTALHQAVVANQPVAVTFLLQNGANPKILDEDSQGCVPIAIDHGAIDAIKALNLRAEDFTTNIFNGKTPVVLAAQSDDNAMLRALLTIERSLGSRHRSSLHQVVGAGDAQLVQKVLFSGAEINRQDVEGRSPLRLAVMQQNVNLTTLLLQAGADVESRCNLGVTALSHAAKINDIAIAELLIRHGADVNATETQNKCPMLVSAAWRGHLDMVKLLIKSGCNIQCRTASGSTALHEATLKTQKEIISELVRAGLSVNTKDGNGSTALYLTSQYRLDATTAEVLLTLGADMETKSKIGYTTLLNAVLANQYDLAKALVDHGADINHPDDSGRMPIMAAASTDAMACFLLLKQHGARMDMVNDEGQSLLHFAATSGSVAIARDLLEEGFDVNFEVINKRLTPLHVAATEGHLDLVRYLIEEGADAGVKSSDGNTALTLACRGKNESHAEIARYIIDLGHINEGISEGSGATLLTTAVQEGNIAVVKILIAKGAKLDDAHVRGKSILHLAATSGNVALFEFLLRQGFPLSDCIDGIDGESVLFKAAAKGHAEMVSAIAERAPELADKPDAKGITPVQRAVLKQHLSVVKVLCERGVNMKQRRGTSAETLLHLAATGGSEPDVKDLIRYLLDQGLSIYEVSYDGYTPLRKAAAHGCMEAATALLDYGAAIDDVGFAQSSGRALDIAVAKGHADIVQLLVTRGASLTFTDERGKLILDAAVAANNADVVKNILNGEGANSYINAVARDNGLGLVHMATLNNNGSIVTLLLQHGARSNLRSITNSTALHIAAANGYGAAAEALYKGAGEDLEVNATDANGDTAMTLAARRGDKNFIRNLMGHYEQLAQPSSHWDVAASAAVESGHFEIVQFFLEIRETLGWEV